MKPSRTALHEAGHTVIALWSNLPVERVTVVREGDAAGACFIRLSKGTPPSITAAVLIAGFLATKIADPYAPSWSSDPDLTEAAKLLPAKADLNDFITKVRNRLVSLWPNVERVAMVLDHRGEIAGEGLIRAVAGLTSWLK